MKKSTKPKLTLNDINLHQQFRFPGSGKRLFIIGFADFVDEDSGDLVTLVMIQGIKGKIEYKPFNTEIIKV